MRDVVRVDRPDFEHGFGFQDAVTAVSTLFRSGRRAEAEQACQAVRTVVSTVTVALMPVRSAHVLPSRVDLQAHRNALRDLDPVAGGVLGRQQRELRAGAGADRSRPSP